MPNVGGVLVFPRHRSVRLVAYGPTPPYRSFDGMRVHATIVCFFSFFPADTISIFRRGEYLAQAFFFI
jgi:hypothetical protein